MARTLNVEAHAVKRDAFLDVAQRFIQTKGYERMSVQDVLDELDASKGAFYHYFDSKGALLEAVVDRFADQAMSSVSPLLAAPDLPALRKIEHVWREIARLKAEQKELVLGVLDVWQSDHNAVVREKLRRLTAAKLKPIFIAIIRQGIAEGVFQVASPEATATVLIATVSAFQEIAAEMMFARRAGAISFEEVRHTTEAFTNAFERILGIDHGSVTFIDEPTLRFWFE